MLYIHGLAPEELSQAVIGLGEKPFRAKQILKWVYEKGEVSWEKMTDLNKDVRSRFSETFSLHSLKLVRTQESCDGETTKYLWELSDGKLVESVLIRSGERRTVCVSSQVGCPARCAFCASGKKGLIRNLTVGEIVEQVYNINKLEKVSNVVFMGMGEPFENYDNVVAAIRLLSDPERLGLSQRRITVSTVGVIEGIQKFTQEGLKASLVLSLHAPNQNIRKKIIPYARKYPLEDILEVMIDFAKITKRDVTYEYTLMAGINDHIAHAEELADLLQGQQCTVNLIPYNPVEGLHLKRPGKEEIETFFQKLVDRGINTTWRYTKGKDIAAACGQLALLDNIATYELG